MREVFTEARYDSAASVRNGLAVSAPEVVEQSK
jgi:hypothetical protein